MYIIQARIFQNTFDLISLYQRTKNQEYCHTESTTMSIGAFLSSLI